MTVLVIGANGRIGRQVCALAAESGVPVRAMVRHRAEEPLFEEQGIDTVQGDLEGDFHEALDGCDQVVFVAGSGPHTSADRTLLVDLHGAVRAIQLAEEAGVSRFIMLSALRASDPLAGPENLRPYLAAKYAADLILQRSTLPHVILRPGKFTDDEPTGLVSTDSDQSVGIDISRGNVALALFAILRNPDIVDREIPLVDGDRPVDAVVG